MKTSRGVAKFGKQSNGVANVGTCSDIGIEDFTEECTVRESHFFFESGVLRCTFVVSSGVKKGREILILKGRHGAGTGFGFVETWCVPEVGLKETSDVRTAMGLT